MYLGTFSTTIILYDIKIAPITSLYVAASRLVMISYPYALMYLYDRIIYSLTCHIHRKLAANIRTKGATRRKFPKEFGI